MDISELSGLFDGNSSSQTLFPVTAKRCNSVAGVPATSLAMEYAMVNRFTAATALLLLASSAQAQTQAPPRPLQRDEIVVVGARLADLQAELARCEAGNCTVREDVIASVRYAEAMFREGDYRQARTALGRSVSRTKQAADSDPFAVAELHTARATVAWHYGDQREALRATAASTRLLNEHAPDSPNALMARMRMISAQAQNFDGAKTLERLEQLASDARSANQALIAMRADIGRSAILHRAGKIRQAQTLLDAVLTSDTPNSGGLRLAAQILSMRLVARSGDPQAVEALIASLTEQQKRQGPVMVWAPPFPTPDGGGDIPVDPLPGLDPRSSTVNGLRWVDIGFAIGADGRVEDVEILRGSARPLWSRPLVSAIAQRRYTPAASIDDLAGRYRVERYTLTGDFIVPIGSLIRRRAGKGRFELLDLTTAVPML